VSVRSLPSGAPICDVPIGPGGNGPAFNAVTGNFYAGAEATQGVYALHGPANCSVDAFISTGDKPIERAISIDPLTNTVYSSVHHVERTAVIDGATDTLSTLVPTGPGDPTGTATDAIAQRVYVAYSQGNRVTEIDTDPTAFTPFATHDLVVGNAPRGVATDPGVSRAYVGVRDFQTLAVITNGVVGAALPLGLVPSPPAVDTTTHCVFVSGDAGPNWKIVKVCDPDTPTLQTDTLKVLIDRCTTDGGVQAALLNKVDQITSAPNANARAGKIGALRNQINAQTGKVIDAACAPTILDLVDAL
jgi:DNA-binding beta-propeller fold protein YncE